MMLNTIIYIILYAAFNVSGAALIKLKLKNQNLSSFREWVNFLFDVHFIIAFVLIMISALALFKALTSNQFSIILPIATGVNFLLTLCVGYFVFEDRLSVFSFIGLILIISGIIIISLNNPSHVQ
jgi:multidrug transporter EmrE-like cation transporter